MGEIAEGYLDGTFCQSCGQLLIDLDVDDELDREPQGFPGFCDGCAPEDGDE